VWFTVDSRLVHATSDTNYKHGDCRDLRPGRGVTVTGTPQTQLLTQFLLAQSIDLKKDD
jgi:hypothetical protein